MSTTAVDLSDQELEELQSFTSLSDPSAALLQAIREYLRFARRMRLKELSGAVTMESTWRASDDAELRGHDGD